MAHGRKRQRNLPKPAAVSPIPLITVEEHHEVFWLWHYAVSQRWLAPERNALLHVDEHSDMSLPRLRRPLSSVKSLADLLRFTRAELDIGNFIWPAVYQGLFARVHWLRYAHVRPLWTAMRICAKTKAQCEFVTGSKLEETSYANAPDLQSAQYSQITPQDSFPQHDSWTLDIDLDYFCCNSFTDVAHERVEITRDAFEKINGNPYHFLRISPGTKISLVEEGERCFLAFNDFPHQQAPEFDAGTIVPRLRELVEWLAKASCPPKLISICRSVQSGYTPRTESKTIEDQLRMALENLYPVDSVPLGDLLVDAD